jgi:hypothetical protein
MDIRWLAPAAILASAAPQCIGAQYMTVDQARALIFAQAQEFVPAPVTLSDEQSQRIEQLAGVKVRNSPCGRCAPAARGWAGSSSTT